MNTLVKLLSTPIEVLENARKEIIKWRRQKDSSALILSHFMLSGLIFFRKNSESYAEKASKLTKKGTKLLK